MTKEGLWIGEDLAILPCDNSLHAQSIAQSLRNQDRWEEVVPALVDVSVRFDPRKISEIEVRDALLNAAKLPPSENFADDTKVMEIPISLTPAESLDGGDIAERLDMAVEELGHWLSSRTYTVTMLGFQPGFVYLNDAADLSLPLLPRLNHPRQKIAAGSVGFRGDQACIYSFEGAGGWPIIGRSDVQLFDPKRQPPALLAPGDRIRFVVAT